MNVAPARASPQNGERTQSETVAKMLMASEHKQPDATARSTSTVKKSGARACISRSRWRLNRAFVAPDGANRSAEHTLEMTIAIVQSCTSRRAPIIFWVDICAGVGSTTQAEINAGATIGIVRLPIVRAMRRPTDPPATQQKVWGIAPRSV